MAGHLTRSSSGHLLRWSGVFDNHLVREPAAATFRVIGWGGAIDVIGPLTIISTDDATMYSGYYVAQINSYNEPPISEYGLWTVMPEQRSLWNTITVSMSCIIIPGVVSESRIMIMDEISSSDPIYDGIPKSFAYHRREYTGTGPGSNAYNSSPSAPEWELYGNYESAVHSAQASMTGDVTLIINSG